MCSLTCFKLQVDARGRLPGSYRHGDCQHHGRMLSEVTQELIEAIGGQSLHHACCHVHRFLAHDVISQSDIGGCAHITLQLRTTHKISLTYSLGVSSKLYLSSIKASFLLLEFCVNQSEPLRIGMGLSKWIQIILNKYESVRVHSGQRESVL